MTTPKETDRAYVVSALTKLLSVLLENPSPEPSHQKLLTSIRNKLSEEVTNL